MSFSPLSLNVMRAVFLLAMLPGALANCWCVAYGPNGYCTEAICNGCDVCWTGYSYYCCDNYWYYSNGAIAGWAFLSLCLIAMICWCSVCFCSKKTLDNEMEMSAAASARPANQPVVIATAQPAATINGAPVNGVVFAKAGDYSVAEDSEAANKAAEEQV